MAGHSKFKNIQHRKGAQDKKRSGLFSKLSKEITVAAKMGGPDPDSNARLRLAMQNARSLSMPKDNITRAVNKSEASDTANYDEIRYEGFGPGGTAIIVESLTDNRNRAATDIRTAFAKNGGNMGEGGSVSYQFDHVGEILSHYYCLLTLNDTSHKLTEYCCSLPEILGLPLLLAGSIHLFVREIPSDCGPLLSIVQGAV